LYYLQERRAEAAHAQFRPDEPADYDAIRNGILQAACERPVCFKDMCYHCHDHLANDEPFLRRLTHVFLVRDPRQAIASHYAMNCQVTCEEIGYEKQASIFHEVSRLTGMPPAVIVAQDLQQDPGGILRALCQRLGIEDRPDALTWQAGERAEWGTWKPWHSEAARASQIQANRKDYEINVDNHAGLAGLYRHHQPFYEEMRRHRIVSGEEASR
jgi:hypothetical protein